MCCPCLTKSHLFCIRQTKRPMSVLLANSYFLRKSYQPYCVDISRDSGIKSCIHIVGTVLDRCLCCFQSSYFSWRCSCVWCPSSLTPHQDTSLLWCQSPLGQQCTFHSSSTRFDRAVWVSTKTAGRWLLLVQTQSLDPESPQPINFCLHCCVPQQSAFHQLTFLPSRRCTLSLPTLTRRTSGHCLGTFRATNFVSLRNNKRNT